MFKFLCISVHGGSGPLLFHPSNIHPGSLPSRAFLTSPLSFLPFCFLSVHISVYIRPPPAASGPSLSVRRKSSALRLTADQFPLLVSCSAAHNAGLHLPPPTCTAGGTWLGCGRRGEGDGSLRDGLDYLDASAGDARGSVPSSTLEFSLRFLRCPSLYLTPPSFLFPRTTVCVPILSLLTEEYFRDRSVCLCPAGPGCHSGCFNFYGPVLVIPPPPYSMAISSFRTAQFRT